MDVSVSFFLFFPVYRHGPELLNVRPHPEMFFFRTWDRMAPLSNYLEGQPDYLIHVEIIVYFRIGYIRALNMFREPFLM